MNYEEKYKQALERARKELRVCGSQDCDAAKQIFRFFPELKESEGERMKKEMLNVFKQLDEGTTICGRNYDYAKWIAWLEKQGNTNESSAEWSEEDKQIILSIEQVMHCASLLNIVPEKIDNIKSWLKSLRPQKQKPDYKVEPKFKVGDWISTNYKVLSVNNEGYLVEDTDGDKINILFENEKFHHLWTIADAKDGDVLSFNDGHGNDCIELIKSIKGEKIEFWFCLTNSNSYEVFDGITPYTNFASRKDATPATKEQRELLFQRMKEAGYEWDAEKKELKKIEPKKVDTDEVIKWIRKYWPFIRWGNTTSQPDDAIRKFKKDFGL